MALCTFTLLSCVSLGQNELCGLDYDGRGTYTAEGISKLCESLKTNFITSLRCAVPLPLLRVAECCPQVFSAR